MTLQVLTLAVPRIDGQLDVLLELLFNYVQLLSNT